MTDCDDPVDRLFGAIDHPVRRRILYGLYERRQSSASLSLAELTGDDQLCCDEATLYHVHLPKLADAGYVVYDSSTDIVEPGDRFEEAVSLLAVLDEHADELPGEWP